MSVISTKCSDKTAIRRSPCSPQRSMMSSYYTRKYRKDRIIHRTTENMKVIAEPPLVLLSF